MAAPDNIISQAGPLPISTQVQTGSVGPATLTVAGSVWSEATNVMIGFEVLVDGQVVGASTIFSNQPSEHRATVPMHLEITLDKPFTGDPPDTAPVYDIELRALNTETNSDQNDNFQATLIA